MSSDNVESDGRLMRWSHVWNWKSALVSAIGRAPIFFIANLPAGRSAAVAAFATEFVYRVVAAGFYGALTAFFARRKSKRLATALALVVLPALAHGVEYVVHLLAGTPHIAPAIVASVGVSMLTTRFSLFVMRRGLFVAGGQSFGADVCELGRLLLRGLASLKPRVAAGETAESRHH